MLNRTKYDALSVLFYTNSYRDIKVIKNSTIKDVTCFHVLAKFDREIFYDGLKQYCTTIKKVVKKRHLKSGENITSEDISSVGSVWRKSSRFITSSDFRNNDSEFDNDDDESSSTHSASSGTSTSSSSSSKSSSTTSSSSSDSSISSSEVSDSSSGYT